MAEAFTTKCGHKACVREGAWGWLGYVCIGEGHPHYKKAYGDVEDDYSVHGGLTYSECSVVGVPCKAGEWWFGFDYCHYGDGGESEEEIVQECELLSEQLKEAEQAKEGR